MQLFINVSLWCYHVKLSSVNRLYRQPTIFFIAFFIKGIKEWLVVWKTREYITQVTYHWTMQEYNSLFSFEQKLFGKMFTIFNIWWSQYNILCYSCQIYDPINILVILVQYNDLRENFLELSVTIMITIFTSYTESELPTFEINMLIL